MAGGRTGQRSLQGSCFLGRRFNGHCAMPPGCCAVSTCFLGGWPFLMPPLNVSAATWASRRWIPLRPYHPATTHGIRIHPLGPWIFGIIAYHSREEQLSLMSITELLCRLIHSKELAKISFGCCIRCTGGAGFSHLQILRTGPSPLSQNGVQRYAAKINCAISLVM